jgi:hypothetical protein
MNCWVENWMEICGTLARRDELHSESACLELRGNLTTVLSAEYVGEYRIRCEFSDGSTGVADVAGYLWGPVFEPLKDPATFRSFTVSPVFGTVVWPNGADIAPESLYELAHHETLAVREPPAKYGQDKV